MTPTTISAPPRVVLYHGDGAVLAGLDDALDAERVERIAVSGPLSELEDDGAAPAVLVLDAGLAEREGDRLAKALTRLPDSVVVVAADQGVAERARGSDRVLLWFDGTRPEERLRALRIGFRHAAVQLAAIRARRELDRSRAELRELNRIGMALMTERDPDRLLVQILSQARQLTASDAGSVYLVEKKEDGTRNLRFTLSQNDSLPDLPAVEFTLPIDRTSLAGFAAVTGEPLSLDDTYRIPDDAPYSHNRGFDEQFGYRTKSMLVVPMVDHRDVVVGVLQLINRKNDPGAAITSEEQATRHVLPYGEHELQLVRSLAGQAAVSIENSQLYREIEHIFESFVKAAVSAIDQRDPTTAGHSVRVATLTCDMAEALGRHEIGPHAGVRLNREQMRELRYAALLHDFGKVGVREQVLVKAKKLPPYLFERVEARFDLIRRTLEAEYYRKRVEIAERANGDRRQIVARLDEEYEAQRREVDRFHAAVRAANEPSVLPQESAQVLEEIAERTFRGIDDEPAPYITANELHFLRIPRGSLDESERKEIESHVQQTYLFLSQIPWTDDLRNVAEIAYGHHEKLDGGGYPRGVPAEQIPVQTRLMTIADIFDALTASDRPYKRALPIDRALDILRMEAKDGLLDSALVDLLVESRAYEKVLERDWREL